MAVTHLISRRGTCTRPSRAHQTSASFHHRHHVPDVGPCLTSSMPCDCVWIPARGEGDRVRPHAGLLRDTYRLQNVLHHCAQLVAPRRGHPSDWLRDALRLTPRSAELCLAFPPRPPLRNGATVRGEPAPPIANNMGRPAGMQVRQRQSAAPKPRRRARRGASTILRRRRRMASQTHDVQRTRHT